MSETPIDDEFQQQMQVIHNNYLQALRLLSEGVFNFVDQLAGPSAIRGGLDHETASYALFHQIVSPSLLTVWRETTLGCRAAHDNLSAAILLHVAATEMAKEPFEPPPVHPRPDMH